MECFSACPTWLVRRRRSPALAESLSGRSPAFRNLCLENIQGQKILRKHSSAKISVTGWLAVQAAREGLLRVESHSHRVCAAFQAH